jgi:threonylcarbamoyladenosine tRNA methylthiotransferase MtaB
VTRQLVDTLAEFPREICPHLHVCLQSGSDRILRRMRRRWGVQRFVDRCRWISQRLDRPALTTDVIVGFPGETEDDFAATCRVVEELGFSKIHVFPFSPRQGTPAADMPDQVPPEVKHHRVRQMMQLEAHCRRRYFRSLVGRTLDVLVEAPLDNRPGWVQGTSCRYAPVRWYAPSAKAGDLLPVTITDAGDDHLLGPTSDASTSPRT